MDKENSILFLGDVVPYKPIKFKNTFKTVINLECPIINSGIPVKGKVILRVDENYLKNIFRDSLFCTSIGNNHILDFGIKGLDSTVRELNSLRVNYFGLINKADSKYNPLILEQNSIKIAFISVVCQSTSPMVEYNNVSYLSILDTDNLINEVRKIRDYVHRIVLYIHWGTEESSYPEKEDIISARKLIDGGVDIIIGSHAHTPQPVEKYNNGIIAYNLGNFIMPELKELPSYFDEKGIAHSTYTKSTMLWNRISWGLLIDMESLEFKIRKYIFLGNRVIRLKITPLDKYAKLNHNLLENNYDAFVQKHLVRRERYRRIIDFIYKPHVPQKLKIAYENWTSFKFR